MHVLGDRGLLSAAGALREAPGDCGRTRLWSSSGMRGVRVTRSAAVTCGRRVVLERPLHPKPPHITTTGGRGGPPLHRELPPCPRGQRWAAAVTFIGHRAGFKPGHRGHGPPPDESDRLTDLPRGRFRWTATSTRLHVARPMPPRGTSTAGARTTPRDSGKPGSPGQQRVARHRQH